MIDDSRQTTQRVPGDTEHEHSHDAELHTHDHYHVSHHHTGGLLGEFEHRAQYHSHGHNHAPVLHAHEKYDAEQEMKEHGGTAHVHDHTSPAKNGM